ncbi:MAG: hypothetical protein BWX66_02107 [Deltaproteobacteria bacterium ADurb.Bin058]|nr:MAG: hypothetical protein BWX66_02107 [Deltaproteobacteria bacterium ADurb.Bin058]
MVLVNPKSEHHINQVLPSGQRLLRARHCDSAVVKDNNHHVGVLPGSCQQAGHARVSKGRVANGANSRELAYIRGTSTHADTCTHIDTCLDCIVWFIKGQGIATNVRVQANALTLLLFVWFQGMAEQGKSVGVSAAIAKGWRPVWCIVKGLGQAFRPRAEQRLANDARGQFAGSGQAAVQFTMDDLAGRLYDASYQVFDLWETLFNNPKFVYHGQKIANLLLWNWGLADSKHRVRDFASKGLTDIVVCYAVCDNPDGAWSFRQVEVVPLGFLGALDDGGLFFQQSPVQNPSV